MTARTVPQLRRHRRKLREATSAFRFLIASPHDLGTGPLILPAGARLALAHSAGLAAGQVTITTVVGRQSWSHPALAIDEIFKGNWAGEDSRVTQSDAPVGTLTVYAVNDLDGTTVPIGTQVIV